MNTYFLAPKTYALVVLGCQMNTADSEKIDHIFMAQGLEKCDPLIADVVIVVTCSVRERGENRMFGIIRDLKAKAKKSGRNILIGVTGCMVRKTGMRTFERSAQKRPTNITLLSEKKEAHNSDDPLFLRSANIDFTFRIEECAMIPYLINNSSQTEDKINSQTLKNKFKNAALPSWTSEKSFALFWGLLSSPSSLFEKGRRVGEEGLREDSSKTIKSMKVTKSKIKTLGSQVNPQNQSIDYLSLTQTRSDPTVANIIIQTGCDNFCTYCIVPHARGREYSRDPNAIIEEVKKAISQGYKEVLLIGQNVNSYGKEQRLKTWNNETMTWQSSDVKTPFRELLNELDALKGIDRIRFTSSNPHDMTKDILDAHFELPNICHHLHIALQSGDNTTLKAMNRRHSVEDFERIVTHLRARDPLFSITTDLIVGFPGETEEQFENTLRAYRACQFDFAYIAQYSERKGTFAADHLDDNVSKETKLQRWHALNDLLAETTFERNRLMIGQNETVLVSAHDPKLGYSGRTRNFKEVFIDIKDSLAIGDLVKVTITEAKNWYLRGKILGK